MPTGEAVAMPEPDLVGCEGRVWGSWHLYEVDPSDYLRVVPVLVPAIVKELSVLSLIDRFFFIRYADEGGHHVRLRFRFSNSGSDTTDQVTRVVKDMAAEHNLIVLPRPFELEVERYGGMVYFPLSLELFCLSSMAVLDWLKDHAEEPRSRQLPALMGLLTSQAVALAHSLDELILLVDYFAGWRERMEIPIQQGDRVFESQPGRLVALLRLHAEATLSAEAPRKVLIEGARALSTATLGLVPAMRNEILFSQMHMTANRLGLRITEESYVTQILKRALEALVQGDPGYARDLDARLARQHSAIRLDALVSRSLEAR